MKKKPVAYIPPDAEINLDAQPLPPPKTQYENRRVVFERDKVKKIIKGKHGQHEQDI